MIPIIGYADKLTVAPGDTISFKVSSAGTEDYRASIVRLISGDPNPDSPGFQYADIPSDIDGAYPSRLQRVKLGSYVQVDMGEAWAGLTSFTASAVVWPTTPQKPDQGVIARIGPKAGFALAIGPNGAEARLALTGGKEAHIRVGKALRERRWARIWCSYDGDTGNLTVGQYHLQSEHDVDDEGVSQAQVGAAEIDQGGFLYIASLDAKGSKTCFNGKIERPIIQKIALSSEYRSRPSPDQFELNILAGWDFSQNISGLEVMDTGELGLNGRLINLPARAMTGSNWSGEEMNWKHRSEEYGAIHFHDDDIDDCRWETDFEFNLPDGIKSGVYAVRLRLGVDEDFVPFFVRPRRGERQADFCLIIPTFTYVIYANHARGNTTTGYLAKADAWGARPWTPDKYPDFGLSTYNFHSDGSGICHTTRLRPILNMRPNFVSIANSFAVSGLRHLPADLHIVQWLEGKGIDYDIVTDEDLDEEGASLLDGYSAVATTSHPEYHTAHSRQAFYDYAHKLGGRLLYLGGNGFYWRIARHKEMAGVYEIRRAEGGIRAWASDPGEYWNAFDGAYGGLWRRNGKPPQSIVGLGFTSQGLFQGSYYRRKPASYDDKYAWIFEGIDDEIIGDFGFSGGGAAGYELDRADSLLGTPANAVILASSEAHQEHFVLVHEEQLTHVDTVPRTAQAPGGRPEELIRADLIYFETPKGGAVFSTGSITFAGSLPWNDGQNNVSQMVENVIRGFLRSDAVDP